MWNKKTIASGHSKNRLGDWRGDLACKHADMRTCGHPLTNTHYFNAPPELGAPAASSLDQPIGGELKERE